MYKKRERKREKVPKRLGGPKKKKSAGVALTHMWTRGSLQ